MPASNDGIGSQNDMLQLVLMEGEPCVKQSNTPLHTAVDAR